MALLREYSALLRGVVRALLMFWGAYLTLLPVSRNEGADIKLHSCIARHPLLAQTRETLFGGWAVGGVAVQHVSE